MTKRGNYLLLLVFIIVALSSACTQQRTPCYEPKLFPAVIGCYRVVNGLEADTTLADPAFYCLDTAIANGAGGTKVFYALLSPLIDSTRWIVVPKRPDSLGGTPIELYDTITFHHSTKLNFVSNACGYVNYYTLFRVATTYHSIDSIALINTSVDNNGNTQHVKIYY